LVIVAFLPLAAQACGGGSTSHACGLLRTSEIASVLGGPPTRHTSDPPGPSQTCGYYGSSFRLLAVAVVTNMVIPDSQGATPVPGLGHPAVAVGRNLYVDTHPGALVIALDMPSASPTEVLNREIALARIALNRV
jgi:hypothetical protein